MIAGGGSSGSSAGFPDPPKGSPGEIAGIARSLDSAAGDLDQCDSGLRGASSSLAGDWQGYAANAYQAASGVLAGVSKAAAETFRDCSHALSGYSKALEHAQTEMGRLRRLYDDAQTRQISAAHTASTLSTKLAAATKPADIDKLQGSLSQASGQASDAGDEASGYARRAVQVLNDFHHDASRYSQVLSGGRVGPGKSLPAGSPFAAPFSGAGVPGLGFGVPFMPGGFGGAVPGGLDAYNGVMPVGDPWNSDIPGYGVYMDSITPEAVPTNDITNVVMVATLPFGGAIEDVLAGGGRALAEELGVGAGGREAVDKAGTDAFQQVMDRGDYRTGDPLNSSKLRDANTAQRDARIGKQVDQEAAQNETGESVLDQLDRSELIPPGVKEVVSHAMVYRGVYRTYLGRLYYLLRGVMSR